MIPADRKSLLFLIIQLLTSGYILYSGPLLIKNLPFLLIQIIGLMLMGWAYLAQQLNKNHLTHTIRGNFLIMRGPYEIIRHPGYAGFLLLMAGFVEGALTFWRFIALIVLIVVTVLKMKREEEYAERHSKEYAHYKKITHRLIPYFY